MIVYHDAQVSRQAAVLAASLAKNPAISAMRATA